MYLNRSSGACKGHLERGSFQVIQESTGDDIQNKYGSEMDFPGGSTVVPVRDTNGRVDQVLGP